MSKASPRLTPYRFKGVRGVGRLASPYRLNNHGALIIDYGKNGMVSDSLQAIRKHCRGSFWFAQILFALTAATFHALLQNCTEEQSESLRTGYWRLLGDGEAPFWEGPDDLMGTRYLAMAIVNKKQGTPVPFE